MAGFGESWLAEDPHDQATRERGLWLGANAAFWVVAVVLHLGGFLRAAPAGTGSVALVDAWEGLCALLAIALTAAAAAVRLRRTAPPSTTSATSATSTTSATAAATP
jgi:hypothetical protein